MLTRIEVEPLNVQALSMFEDKAFEEFVKFMLQTDKLDNIVLVNLFNEYGENPDYTDIFSNRRILFTKELFRAHSLRVGDYVIFQTVSVSTDLKGRRVLLLDNGDEFFAFRKEA